MKNGDITINVNTKQRLVSRANNIIFSLDIEQPIHVAFTYSENNNRHAMAVITSMRNYTVVVKYSQMHNKCQLT